MDYLRQISSALGKGGGPLPGISVGDEVTSYAGQSLWRLYEGVRKEDQLPVSVFVFDGARASPAQIAMAHNAVRKLRSLRFPYVLEYLDMAETNGTIYLAVERVTPLTQVLDGWRQDARDPGSDAWVAWGVSHIASAAAFLHTQVGAIHGNIHAASVFLSGAGEWLLGGFETMAPASDAAFLATYGGQPPHAHDRVAPEVEAGWGHVADVPVPAVDSFAIGVLAIDAFNDQVPANLRTFPAGRIPPLLYPLVRQMVHADPHTRLSAADLVAAGNQPGGFLTKNELVRASALVEEFRLADAHHKEAILGELEQLQPRLLPTFSQCKVLPVLVEAFRSKPIPNGLNDSLELSARVLLPLMLRLGEALDEARWRHTLGTPVLDAFGTPYSPMRAALLQHLGLYVAHLDTRAVMGRVWPAVAAWLEDPHEVVRAAVLESLPLLAPKLSDRVLNNDLLRQLAKTQTDRQPALRIQTTQLLGKLTPFVTPTTRASVLVPAFARSLKDVYEQARLAGVDAFRTNEASFDAEASARSVVPALAPCLVDRNREVRETASTTLHTYLDKIQAYAAKLSSESSELPPAPTLAGAQASAPSEGRSAFSFLSATAGHAASALSDWAIAQLDADEAPTDAAGAKPGAVVLTPTEAAAPAPSAVPVVPAVPPAAPKPAVELPAPKPAGAMRLGAGAKPKAPAQAAGAARGAAIRPNFGAPEARPDAPAKAPAPPAVRPAPAPAVRPTPAPAVRPAPAPAVRPAPAPAAAPAAGASAPDAPRAKNDVRYVCY
ncbi:hypothetical protein CBS9595_004165 [Malassezia furfur]|nr:hypothetical protein CBS9595_004165 [Malassezia furfur]